MIVPMTKYDIVLFARQKEDFLNRLQDLGLVDITTTGWEPDEEARELMLSIERHNTAIERLREMAKQEGFTPGEPYANGDEAYERYVEAARNLDELNAAIAQAEKEAAELKAWGMFDPKQLGLLRENGVVLHFFSVYSREYEAHREEWESQYNIQVINEVDGSTYFVAVTGPDGEVAIDAQEVKAPTMPAAEREAEAVRLAKERTPWEAQMARAAASVDLIARHRDAEQEHLQFSQASKSVAEEAEGSLVVMEGWATQEDEEKVEVMLAEYPNVFFIKSKPTPEDDTPTLLKNGKTSRMFEIIGSFYSQPKYGTMDLTKWFGPFYALFFGLCLADAGYGLLYLIAGIVMITKSKAGTGFRNLANLVTILGTSTLICGAFLGSFFGVAFAKQFEAFAGFQRYILSEDNFFILALGIGVVQILLAMILKVVMYTKYYAFKYTLSTIGWFLVLVSILPNVGDALGVALPASIMAWGAVKLSILGIGLFLMLFMNKPGKNPFVNFGSGLWDTYNNLVGFISDFLSYIRLFAIGLSGGILASVFNDLSLGLSPDIPVVKQIVMVLILLIGHGITLFMSSISSFVHPMRLTFVEFYKNAGFEDTQRLFTPLKRNKK